MPLLHLSGPYKINGVPLRRVNQAYVIATSTKVDLSGVKLPEIDDSYFKRSKTNSSSAEETFFSDKPKPAIVSEQRKGDQKAVDAALLQAITKVSLLHVFFSFPFRCSLKVNLLAIQCSQSFFFLSFSHMYNVGAPSERISECEVLPKQRG